MIDDDDTNPSRNPSFASVLEARMSRRTLLKGSMGLAAGTFFGGSLMACADDDVTPPPAPQLRLDFTAVGKSLADAVVVPAGYTASVLFRLGDPIAAGVADYTNNGSEPGASHALRAGDHHDAIYYFGMGSGGTYSPAASDRGLLVMNHEAITPLFLHVNGPTIVNGARTVNDEVIKELNAHGVSIIEVTKTGGTVAYNKSSTYNRRITTNTEMILSGPVARTPAMVTKYSTDGSRTRGTVNNCANGYTPWGTYLTCEENWAGYFRRVTATDNPKRSAKELASFSRYGVAGNGRELWATAVAADAADTTFSRWNAEKLGTSADGSDDFRNVANTYGWVVEIDPFATTSTPKKRTALGRFAHEGAWIGPVTAGKPLVFYSGDDSRNEYIYKYVSTANWDPADANKGLAAGDKYLDDGKLYVARFNADGTGVWLELRFGVNGITAANPAYAFADQADVILNTRLAADAAGATRMDRPEWGAVNPKNGDVYMTLTNNNSALRTLAATDGPNPRFYNDPTTSWHGSARQSQRPHHPVGRGRRQRRGHDVEVGHLPVRRALHRRSRQREHLRTLRQQRLFQPRRVVVRQQRHPVDPDRRRRLHRRDQLHAARRRAGHRRRRRQEDHHERRRRRVQDGGDVRERAAGRREAPPLPRGPEGLRNHGHRGNAGPQGDLREHPASGRRDVGGQFHGGQLHQQLARRRRVAPAFGDDRHHQERRRRDRRRTLLTVLRSDRHPPRGGPLRRVVPVPAPRSASTPASAQDAARGRAFYADICARCHADPPGSGAVDPLVRTGDQIRAAINRVSPMKYLGDALSAADLADIAAYFATVLGPALQRARLQRERAVGERRPAVVGSVRHAARGTLGALRRLADVRPAGQRRLALLPRIRRAGPGPASTRPGSSATPDRPSRHRRARAPPRRGPKRSGRSRSCSPIATART